MTDQKKKPITTTIQARAEAKYRAGHILDAVLANGWGLDQQQIDAYGEQGAALVNAALTELAGQLRRGVRVG